MEAAKDLILYDSQAYVSRIELLHLITAIGLFERKLSGSIGRAGLKLSFCMFIKYLEQTQP